MNLEFKNYKDIHRDDRVFIIGNGPSLADTNLNLIKDEISIAMNRVSLIYEKNLNWRPTYYLFSSTNVKNPTWGKQWTESVRSTIGESKTTSFIAEIFKNQIDPSNEFPEVKWFASLSENKPLQDGTINKESFSTDIVERIDKSGTTMNLALQLAYHMGFKEIILLGCDLGWVKDKGTQNDPNHFDKSYRANIPNPYKANHQMRNVHKLAKEVFNRDKPDVLIYNATIRTVLDVYPIIDFESYLIDSQLQHRTEDQNRAKEYWSNLKDTSNEIGALEKIGMTIKRQTKRILKKILMRSQKSKT